MSAWMLHILIIPNFSLIALTTPPATGLVSNC